MTSSQFQVDLRGLVDLLSQHLYSSPDVYVRELLQNAADAITARGVGGTVRVEVLRDSDGTPVVSVEDDGAGLTEQDVVSLLATIGASSKRDDLLVPREDFLGRFGIGLLSCFLVTDEVVVVSLSASGGPGVRWTGRSDGTYEHRVLAPDEGRTSPGTTVWLRARSGSRELLDAAHVRRLVDHYGRLLPVRITVVDPDGETTTGGGALPWVGADEEQLLALGATELGETFLDALPLDLPAAGLSGVAYVLPTSPSPASRQRHTVYLKRMLLSDSVDGLLPPWAFFVRVLLDASALRPLASREGLYDDEVLRAVQDGLGAQLRSWLVRLAEQDPVRLQRIVRVHALALKALAVHDDELLALFARWLPLETTLGQMTAVELVRRDPLVRYTETVDDFSQVAQVAGAEGLCLVNGGYTYDAALVERLPSVLPGVTVERVDASSLVSTLADVGLDDRPAALALVDTCGPHLAPYDCEVEVRTFSPATLPCLYTTGESARLRRRAAGAADVAGGFWGPLLTSATAAHQDSSALLCLNLANPLVRTMASSTSSTSSEGVRTAVEVLYLQALLSGRHPLRPRETTLLTASLGRLVTGALDG